MSEHFPAPTKMSYNPARNLHLSPVNAGTYATFSHGADSLYPLHLPPGAARADPALIQCTSTHRQSRGWPVRIYVAPGQPRSCYAAHRRFRKLPGIPCAVQSPAFLDLAHSHHRPDRLEYCPWESARKRSGLRTLMLISTPKHFQGRVHVSLPLATGPGQPAALPP